MFNAKSKTNYQTKITPQQEIQMKMFIFWYSHPHKYHEQLVHGLIWHAIPFISVVQHIYFIINTTIKIFLKLIPRLIIRTSYNLQTQKNKVAQYSIRRTPRKTKEAGMVPVLL